MEISMTRRILIVPIAALFLNLGFAQEKITVNPADSTIASGLDLQAVGDIFKESQTLEDFEKALNDSSRGVNNLDLDRNGRVDFIRVVDEVAEDVHLIILQVSIDSLDYQDVATIEVEKNADQTFNLQLHGNSMIFGDQHYVSPIHEDTHTWPVITWIYAPSYVPYRSPYFSGFYPSWWRPFHPVPLHIYRAHILRWRYRPTFAVVHTTRVRNIHRVAYVPRVSPIVEQRQNAAVRRKMKKEAIRGNKKAAKNKGVKRNNGRRR